jgi:hypothetical protein
MKQDHSGFQVSLPGDQLKLRVICVDAQIHGGNHRAVDMKPPRRLISNIVRC